MTAIFNDGHTISGRIVLPDTYANIWITEPVPERHRSCLLQSVLYPPKAGKEQSPAHHECQKHPGHCIFIADSADIFYAPSIDLMLSLFYWVRTSKTYNGFYLFTFIIVMILMSIAGIGYSHYEMILIPMYIYPVSLFASECKKVHEEIRDWDFMSC